MPNPSIEQSEGGKILSQIACRNKIPFPRVPRSIVSKSNYQPSVVMLGSFCWYNCINIGHRNSIECCQVTLEGLKIEKYLQMDCG